MSRPSPSMAVALLALFVALGGTGYAASKVNGRNIVNRSISGAKIKRNTLGGAEIRESRLGKVPSASDTDQLNGRPASAYLLVGNTAANSSHLNGFDASAFLLANGTAANASALGGLPPSAYLGAGATAADAAKLGGKAPSAYLGAADTAANADELDGKDSADFLAAEGKAADADKLDGLDSAAFAPAAKVLAAGPVTLAMPATSGQKATSTLATDGPLSLVGECENSGGTPIARVTLQQSGGEHFTVFVGEVASGKATSGGGSATIVQVTATGGLPVWDAARHTFSALTNPATGVAALQGSATAITNSGFGTNQCYVAAAALAS
jgi:hypothetical protein